MSERKDEKWLDTELQRAVNGTTPVFDAQAWKQKHRAEYEVLLSRKGSSKVSVAGVNRARRWVWNGSFCRLAVAAGIIVAIGLFLQPVGDRPEGPGVQANEPPVRMLSLMSLRMAYQRGGFEALDQQLQESLDTYGPRPLDVSRRELSESVKGS
jgi:hypothetical protein